MTKRKIFIVTFVIALISFATKAQNLNVTPLMEAVINEDINGVKFFSKSGGKKGLNEKNFGGATALHLAVRNDKEEIALILINNGANLDAKDNEGFTPMMRAAMNGNYNMLQMLISNGASPYHFNNSGESVIVQSANSGCFKCLGILFSRFDFKQSMKPEILKKQLEEAFLSGQKQQNDETQKIVSDYLNKILSDEEGVKKKAEERRKPAEPLLIIEKEVTTPTDEKRQNKQQIPQIQPGEPELIEIKNQPESQNFDAKEMKNVPSNPASLRDVRFLPKKSDEKIANPALQNTPKMSAEDIKMMNKKKQIDEDRLLYIPPFY